MQEPISAKQERVAVRDIVGTTNTTASLSAAQRLALFQFLSASVEPFSEDHISPAILRRLLHTEDLSCEVAFDEKSPSVVYEAGKPANFFTLVVEGEVQVEIGDEKLKFECRSFSYFGVKALCNILTSPSQPESYVPDFTVRLAANCLLFTVTQQEYSLAYRTSLLSRQKEGERKGEGSDPQPQEEEQFCSEWRKMEEDTGGVALDGLSTLARWRKRRRRRKPKQPQSVGYHPLLSEEETDWVSIEVEPLVEAGPAAVQQVSDA